MMPTSYEQRLAFLQKCGAGSLAFYKNIPGALNIKGEGWELFSSDSRFAMLNGVIIHSSRKGIVEEVLETLEKNKVNSDIRLVGPGISQLSSLSEHGYKNLGSTPFMMWSADNSLDNFQLRDNLTVRRLDLDDIKTASEIYMDVYGMSEELVKDMTRMFCVSQNDYTYGLFKDNEMVSLVTAMVYQDSVGIWSMGTPTKHQKNGYGKELLSYVMKSHKDMGTKEFFLYASSAGKFLYDKCGWITLDYWPYLSKS
jgi:N-acetylglutamate synthase-like GNAT family acetyltransferase